MLAQISNAKMHFNTSNEIDQRRKIRGNINHHKLLSEIECYYCCKS